MSNTAVYITSSNHGVLGGVADSSSLEEGVTILIHKKGVTSDPANFRPITLQPCWYKIYSKVYATSLFEFLSKNKYIDSHLSKGFLEGG